MGCGQHWPPSCRIGARVNWAKASIDATSNTVSENLSSTTRCRHYRLRPDIGHKTIRVAGGGAEGAREPQGGEDCGAMEPAPSVSGAVIAPGQRDRL